MPADSSVPPSMLCTVCEPLTCGPGELPPMMHDALHASNLHRVSACIAGLHASRYAVEAAGLPLPQLFAGRLMHKVFNQKAQILEKHS